MLAAPPAPRADASGSAAAGPAGDEMGEAPLPSEIHQYYLPISLSTEQVLRRWAEGQGRPLPPDTQTDAALHYSPALLAQGVVRFFERKSGLNEEEVSCCLVRTIDRRALLRWEEHVVAPLDPAVLGEAPFARATFDPVPVPLATARKLVALEKDFVNYLYRSMAMSLWYNPVLRAYSRPGQSELEFRASCEESARQSRDAETAKLQARYQAKTDALRAKVTALQHKIEALEAEVGARRTEESWTNIESVWDALTKRRIRRPISTAQRAKRMAEQAVADLDTNRAKLAELNQQVTDLEAQRTAEWQSVTEKWFQAVQGTQPVTVTPKKADIRVELLGIAWIPYWVVQLQDNVLRLPAFEV